MRGSEKKGNNNAYDVSFIKRVTRKFLEILSCSCPKQLQINVQKQCTALSKLLFLLIRPIVVFSPFSLCSPLSITRFHILFERTIILSRAWLLALAKSINVKLAILYTFLSNSFFSDIL